MRKRLYLSSRVVLLLTFLCVFALAGPNSPEPAPRFHAKTMSGENFTNETTKGKVVLFEFWTTWCPYCREEESLVDDINKEFSGKGLVLLAVDVGESKKTVQRYLKAHPRSVPIVLNEDTNLAAMYAAKSYPIYVAVDRDGNIAGIQRGAGGERALRNLLADAGLESNDKDDNTKAQR